MSTLIFRDVIQAVSGPKKGLIAQVLATTEDGKIQCFHRDFHGTPNFFTITNDDGSWRKLGGVALIGPAPATVKPDPMPEPSLPPPLDPQELLEPLPPGTPVVPMNQEQVPLPLSEIEPEPAPPATTRRTKLLARVLAPKFPMRLLIRNGLGEETVITIQTPTPDAPASRFRGIARIRAKHLIKDVGPWTVEKAP